MTRVGTQNQFQVSVRPKSADFRRFICILSFVTLLAIVYLIIKTPIDSLDDPSDQFLVKNIPATYTKLEGIDPDERDVFEGFRTSFLPEEEIMLAQRISKRDVYNGNVTSDSFIWGIVDNQYDTPNRVKRKSHFTSKDYDRQSHTTQSSAGDEYYDDYIDDYSEDAELGNADINKNHEKNAIFQEQYVDRGPLDDVVEQVRRQPELEEGEMGSSAHLYKPSKSHTGIHAFWKGEGDRLTIRKTQAIIMKRYMDAEADPCQDFYQYACGNWASLNPIPADKAGVIFRYDTFEMLRENLDTVLKDLLEFKSCENLKSSYPGEHLDLSENFLTQPNPNKCSDKQNTLFNVPRRGKIFKGHDKIISDCATSKKIKKLIEPYQEYSDIISRIRRYLDQKPKQITGVGKKTKYGVRSNLANNIVSKIDKQKSKNTKHKFDKRKRATQESTKKTHVGRKLQMYYTRVKKKHNHGKPVKLTRDATLMKPNDPANGDAALKSRFLFASCMNHEILEKRGHQPLLDLLNLLGGWPILNQQWNSSTFDWLELMAKLRVYNNDILISEWVGPDIKNSDEFVIQFDQTSLGLPTRDYFLQESNKVYLDAYKTYLVTIAKLLGGDPDHVRVSADKLISFEISLARITSAPEDRRNVSEIYKRMPISKLIKLVPEVDWIKYLCIVMNKTIHKNETIVLFAHTYVLHLVKLIQETDADTLANYLLWRFVRHRVNNLDDRFQTAKQQFYYILFGREEAPPRWKNCISQVNSNMGMALGSMFVRKYFDEMSKNDTLTMTREIQQSFREILNMTDWIDSGTKKLAGHKVDSMMLRIGYPDFILNTEELNERYKEVKIHPDKYFENILNILQHLTKMEQSRIGQPVNKSLWNTAPAVVNAYYSRNKNQIMFPAGILQPPFYHRHFPRSLNYGGIGVVIGHEITHGFDDKGRLFDCEGNLHRWWSDPAIEAFHRRAQCLIDQYGRYVVPEVNMKLDGVNTQGENIADNGGVKQAFHAYLKWLKTHGSEDETLPGLNHTHTQLFFLNFAQVWCGAMRPEAMRNKLKTAVHSPGRFRVIGTLSNSQDFANEFNCPPGSPMNPKHKCSVW
ncbi:PREDICTED: endothelin-converting enzyme 1-like isoform X1 [Papilio polytes]|uniref:endothelin-converting enzyme 1-like isoform X1 n=1 Tax=Papilio polytes TaxID=76194 RepID=UPI000675EDDE|nr:PREDICTED: endothelin-converting enzyme 1-like isoform X1 [Papilio polytes]